MIRSLFEHSLFFIKTPLSKNPFLIFEILFGLNTKIVGIKSVNCWKISSCPNQFAKVINEVSIYVIVFYK